MDKKIAIIWIKKNNNHFDKKIHFNLALLHFFHKKFRKIRKSTKNKDRFLRRYIRVIVRGGSLREEGVYVGRIWVIVTLAPADRNAIFTTYLRQKTML